MTHDVSMLRAKLRQSMDKVGRTNGHACPSSSSNVDPVLHELFVAGEATAYWKTRHDAAKAEALALGEGLDGAVDGVIKMDAGTSVTIADGELYTLSVDIKKPAARLDQAALRSYLMVKLGLDRSVVEQAFDAATTKNAPAKTIRVSSK